MTLENQLTTEKRRKAEESAALKASTPPPKSVEFDNSLSLLLILCGLIIFVIFNVFCLLIGYLCFMFL